MKRIDLRSDTITKPSDAMRRVMYEAEVGDDVYEEDPSAIRLQELAAEITGKEASLFVSSGTMGNLISLYLNGGRANEILVHKNSHILHYELSCATALAGAMPVAVEGERGILKPDELEKHIRSGIYYMARVSMVSIENSHNKEGGTCYGLDELKGVRAFATKHGLKAHMDGARLFNASVSTGISVPEISDQVDTLTFCLSKALGAPAGSMLCGPADFIAEAKRIRKMLGGGMRQVGVLASAGTYALENNVAGLVRDHEHAKKLAEAVLETSWAEIDTDAVESNIVYFDTPGQLASQVEAKLGEQGLLCFATGENTIRFVTHLDVSETDCQNACDIIRSL